MASGSGPCRPRGQIRRKRRRNNPRGGKPDGVSGYQVFYKIGPDAPAETRDCVFAGNTTRSKHVVTFGGGEGNKQVWYIAVPFNTRGETGPMSETIAATIAA